MKDYTGGKNWKIEKHQQILETAFRLFADRGIESVTMPEIAKACGIGRATLFRYFPSKLELVFTIGARKWDEYIIWHESLLSESKKGRISGAERMRFYMDAFLDLYRNHSDLLRFTYNFNSFLKHESGIPEQKRSFTEMTERLSMIFHEIYEKGCEDGTLNTELSEPSMFSASFHIMLSAVTRYAVGLVYLPEDGTEPEKELIMLEELLLSRFTQQQ